MSNLRFFPIVTLPDSKLRIAYYPNCQSSYRTIHIMENKEIFALTISIAGGLFALLGSIFNWAFFFENRRAQLFTDLLGRTGARIFYAFLGLMLFFLAYKILTK